MKSYIEKDKEVNKPIEFPCLMQASYDAPHVGSFVVLFGKYGEGCVVQTSECWCAWQLGWYSESWVMSCFKPFTDKIVLQNE